MNELSCEVAADYGREARRGRLGDAPTRAWAAHLATCQACRDDHRRESALDAALGRLPRPAAPEALTARLHALVAASLAPTKDSAALSAWRDAQPGLATRSRPRKLRWLVAAAVVAVAGLLLFFERAERQSLLAEEAVSDHLRILYADRGPEIESGGIHQVKPWFEGRLDFAPVLAFDGDDQFPLVGGSVALFRERKAAAFAFKHRLHRITLLVFRADGLPALPSPGPAPGAHLRARGFDVVLWKQGGLGYALVADMAGPELDELARKISASK
jgi:anti-sigma factor RsiW